MIGYFDGDKLLGVGAVYKAKDGSIQKRELTEDEKDLVGKGTLSKVKKKAKEIILSKYSITDQLNILRRGVKADIDAMNLVIDGVLEEVKKGKKADFTNIK